MLSGLAGDDRLLGGAGADALSGGEGADVLEGGAGDDALDGGLGADLLAGGAGADRLTGDAEDTVTYAGSEEGVLVSLANGQASGGDAEGDTIVGISNLTGSDRTDTLIGDAQANALEGGGGADVLAGLGRQ